MVETTIQRICENCKYSSFPYIKKPCYDCRDWNKFEYKSRFLIFTQKQQSIICNALYQYKQILKSGKARSVDLQDQITELKRLIAECNFAIDYKSP